MTTEALDNLPFGVYIVNSLGVIDYFNPKMQLISGIDNDKDIIGENVFDLPSYKKYGLDKYMRAGLAGRAFHIEGIKYVSHNSGKESYRFYHGIPIKDNEGRVQKLLCIVEDKTEKIKIEKELTKSRRRYKAIFDNLPFMVFSLDRKGKLLDANSHAEKFVNRKKEEFIGKNFSKFGTFGKKQILLAANEFRKNLQGKITKKSVYEITLDDGQKKTVELIGIPIINEQGKVESVLDVGSDITKRLDAEEWNKLITENTSDLISITEFNFKAKFLYVNPAYTRLLGYDGNKLIGKSGMDFIHPDDQKKLRPLLSKYLKEKILKTFNKKFVGISEKIEYRIKDGQDNWHLLVSTVNVIDNKLLFVSKDITEQKKVEQALRKSEEQFRIIFETTQDAIFIKDKKLRYVQANSRAEKYLQLPTSKIINKTDKELFTSVQAGRIQKIDQRVLAGESIKEEITRVIQDKKINYYVTKIPLRDDKGQITGICGVAHDITGLKDIERKLKQEKNKIQAYLDLVGVIIVALDKSGKVILINKTGSKILEYKEDEIIGKNWLDSFIPKEQKQEVKMVFAKLIAGEKKSIEHHENKVIIKSGEKKLIDWHNTFLKNDKGEIVGVLSSGEDITEQKKMEEKIAVSEREWSKTFDSMADGVSIHSPNYIIINANQSLCNMLGKTKKELIGKKCFAIFHDKNQPIIKCPMAGTLESKKENRVEIFEPKLNRWLSIYTSPIKNKEGQIVKIIHVVRDITERKQTEEKSIKHNQELEQFNKLMVGRELKMAELKKKIKELEEKTK